MDATERAFLVFRLLTWGGVALFVVPVVGEVLHSWDDARELGIVLGLLAGIAGTVATHLLGATRNQVATVGTAVRQGFGGANASLDRANAGLDGANAKLDRVNTELGMANVALDRANNKLDRLGGMSTDLHAITGLLRQIRDRLPGA